MELYSTEPGGDNVCLFRPMHVSAIRQELRDMTHQWIYGKMTPKTHLMDVWLNWTLLTFELFLN